MKPKQKEEILNEIENCVKTVQQHTKNGERGRGILQCLKLKNENVIIDITVSNSDLDEDGGYNGSTYYFNDEIKEI